MNRVAPAAPAPAIHWPRWLLLLSGWAPDCERIALRGAATRAAPAMILAICISIEGTGRERTVGRRNSVRLEASLGPGYTAPILRARWGAGCSNPVSKSDLSDAYRFRTRVLAATRLRRSVSSDASVRQVSRPSIRYELKYEASHVPETRTAAPLERRLKVLRASNSAGGRCPRGAAGSARLDDWRRDAAGSVATGLHLNTSGCRHCTYNS
jgi:hypothetical protein